MPGPVKTDARTSEIRRQGSIVSDKEEPGSDKVTARTRAFEEIDAQVFPGPGRGATRLEAAASDRWGGPSPATVDAYRRMAALVAKHGLPRSDPMSRQDHEPRTTPVARTGWRSTTPATPSTKPRSSTGVNVPHAARRLQSRLPRKADT